MNHSPVQQLTAEEFAQLVWAATDQQIEEGIGRRGPPRSWTGSSPRWPTGSDPGGLRASTPWPSGWSRIEIRSTPTG